MKFFMILLGAMPPARNTEQHDVFFGVGEDLKALKPDIIEFWPEGSSSLHIDVVREINSVDGYRVSVMPIKSPEESESKLFFLNLGGYKPNDFEEYHYKMLVAAPDKAAAVLRAKNTAFYKHYNVKSNASSHIDEKYGIDVDDFYMIEDILLEKYKALYKIVLKASSETSEDVIDPGYHRINKL